VIPSSGDRCRRLGGGKPTAPFAIIGGMVASFSLFTLVGGSLLSYLGLPATSCATSLASSSSSHSAA